MAESLGCTMSSNTDTQPRSPSILSYLPYPLSSCIASTSRNRLDGEEHSRLLSQDQGDTDYDDSDAISLLSNIARRNDASSSASKAARRRRARLRRSRQRQRGVLGLGDLASQVLACGVFGRRVDSDDDDEEQERQQQQQQQQQRGQGQANFPRSQSQDSMGTDVAAAAQSGEEDAGSLGDDEIARLGHLRATENDSAKVEPVAQATSDKADEEADTAAAIAAQQAAEEAQLAQEEEAALVKARRKAERRAAKQAERQRQRQRGTWATEAEAEAAAGGFGFAEEQDEGQDWGAYERGQYSDEQGYYQHYNHQGYDEHGEYHSPDYGHAPQPVIHHHHYYDDEQDDEQAENEYRTSVPNAFSPSQLPPLPPTPSTADDANANDAQDDDHDEDEADMAGLGLGSSPRRRKSKRNKEEYGSSSQGSGSRQAGSNGSTHERTSYGGSSYSEQRKYLSPSLGSNPTTASSRPRHARTGSRSTNSSSGGGRTRIVDGSGKTLTRGGGGGATVTSPIVATSPILYEEDGVQEDILPSSPAQFDSKADAAAGGFDDFEMPSPAAANQEAEEFSGRSSPRKMSYKEKRSRAKGAAPLSGASTVSSDHSGSARTHHKRSASRKHKQQSGREQEEGHEEEMGGF